MANFAAAKNSNMESGNLIKEGIKQVITEMMDSVVTRVGAVSDPFIPEEHHAKKPLYATLVPDEIFKGSHFERRFVTPFGKRRERLAKVVATANLGECILGASIEGSIRDGRLKRIQEILNSEDHSTAKTKKRKPDWENDLKYVPEGKATPFQSKLYAICSP